MLLLALSSSPTHFQRHPLAPIIWSGRHKWTENVAEVAIPNSIVVVGAFLQCAATVISTNQQEGTGQLHWLHWMLLLVWMSSLIWLWRGVLKPRIF